MSTEQSEEFEQQEIEIEAIGIEVSSQPIELYKVFKIANLVNGGGEAKHIISEGYVAVNGELETRKRRKMVDGDLIEFNQEYYVVILVDEEVEPREIHDDELVADEYRVSDEEVEQINQQLEPSSVSELGSEAELETDDAGEPESQEKKPKGRKSIQFF